MTHQTEIIAAVIFALAVLHTFSVKIFQEWAHRFPQGSVGENLMHLLGEIEVVFGIWSMFLFLALIQTESLEKALEYIDTRNFTEPLFVFAVMVVASTKPIIDLASWSITNLARLLPLPRSISFYITCLIAGPIMGSFITEPAAMTVTTIILIEKFYEKKISDSLKYATLGLLFVNISIGGTLTHFAAPPVVMVAGIWNWDTPFMMAHFGWKAVIAIIFSTIAVLVKYKGELRKITLNPSTKLQSPALMSFIHCLFLALIVATAHHPKIFSSFLLFFLGFATVTKEYQFSLKVREGLLVGFFLGGLVTLGGLQAWWINDVVRALNAGALFVASIGLTGIFDNAALTYLGSLVPDITDASKYALVSGAVVGGGLTVIANAPNPIGYGLLNSHFGRDGINPLQLLKAAIFPTFVAALCFWFLP